MYNSEPPGNLPSSAQLTKSTLLALAVAALLLVTVVMPAEYGLDPTGIGRVLGLQAMGEIKMAAQAQQPATSTAAAVSPPRATAPAAAAAVDASSRLAGTRSDTMSLTLKPGQGAEIKLKMGQGAVAQFRWQAQGGVVNFDAHGESTSPNRSLSYKKGKQAVSDEGSLEAAFTGQHGWYWKNIGKSDVRVDLTTSGQYQSIERVL